MRVLVTGGGGFIGSHVVDKLMAKGMTPRIFDLSASPYHSPLEVETFTGSITDPGNLDLAMRDCDAVIHLAAVADVGHVLADPVLAEEVNTRGTLQVLEAACRAKVGRVVYGSTTWVYSDCPEQEVDEETAIPAPRHLYTSTKLAGETYCASYSELYDLDFTILRFGIPYGPRARAAGVVAKFTDLSFEGKALTIAGDGSTTRSFIYVEDLADGIVASLAPQAAGRTYNLSGDEITTILEIAERVQENVDTCEITHTPPRPGDFPGKTISNERALAELGWKAETPFKEGVRQYVEWVKCTTRPPDPIPGTKPSMNGNERAAGALLAGASALRVSARDPRVLILTADIGEGHDLPARMIAADLEKEVPGSEVTIDNGLEAMGKLTGDGGARRLESFTFRRAPWLFDVQYWLFAKFAPTRWLVDAPRLPDRRPRPAAADRRAPRPDVDHLDLPGRDRRCSGCCVRSAASRFLCSRRSPTLPGSATGPTLASTSTTSPTPSRSRKSSGWSGRAPPSGRARRSRPSSSCRAPAATPARRSASPRTRA